MADTTLPSTVNILAIIPARGGSKGLPSKNILQLGGKPLIAHSIEAARSEPRINKVIVSTDDVTIARVAEQYGAEVPFLRPAHLSQDASGLDSALDHARFMLEHTGYQAHMVVVLLPTHPFRTPELMSLLVDKLRAGHNPVLTMRAVRHSPSTVFHLGADGLLLPLIDPQVCQHVSRGALYLRSYGTFSGFAVHGQDRPYYHILDDEIQYIDIDDALDMRHAEEALRLTAHFPHGGAL